MNNEKDIVRANALAKKFHLAIAVVLLVAYGIQLALGAVTTVSFVLVAVTLVAPVIAAWVISAKHPDSQVVKHAVGIGYGVFYLVACFTTHEQAVFVYSIPMIIAISIYCDYKFSLIVNVLAAVVALCHSLWLAAIQGWSQSSITSMAIEIFAVCSVAAFSLLSNKFISNLNESKIKNIDEAGKRTEDLLANIKDVSASLADEISSVSDEMTTLTASSQETLAAMHEVQEGIKDTADSVQNQMVKTEVITEEIKKVTDVTKGIADSVASTVEAIHEGRDNLHILVDNSKASGVAGEKAVNEVEALKEITGQMEDIVKLIKDIASKTSLLSLNASIEAARAGDAGRGFSVVAGEISNLAGQTKAATDNISKLIGSVTGEMAKVGTAIEELVTSNGEQNKSADVMANSFEKIVVNARLIRSGSNDLNGIVGNLETANAEIVESIRTISAVTEQVTANTEATCNATEQNEASVEEMQTVVSQLKENADRLKNM